MLGPLAVTNGPSTGGAVQVGLRALPGPAVQFCGEPKTTIQRQSEKQKLDGLPVTLVCGGSRK